MFEGNYHVMLFTAQFFSEAKKSVKNHQFGQKKEVFPWKESFCDIFQEQLFVKKAIKCLKYFTMIIKYYLQKLFINSTIYVVSIDISWEQKKLLERHI